MKISILLALLITFALFAAQTATAQTKDKIEIGVQTTSLTIFAPDFEFNETQAGVGGRVTYNLNRSIAAEAEINFFPQEQSLLSAEGNMVQAQFGVKAGKRFKKFGIFAKVRPGFLSVDNFFSLQPGPVPVVNGQFQFNFTIERTTFFTLDAGGVLELYPSKRTIVRFEAGDTLIRHPARFDPVFANPPFVELVRPAKFKHNFQFTAGVGFRLGDFPDTEDNLKSSVDSSERTPRYEVGAQFTSLSVDPPTAIRPFPAIVGEPPVRTEPGFGGRFTFNLTESIAMEAEGNFFTRDRLNFPNPSGHIFQGQFGAKVGKRWDKWGLFGKARPGFVGFTKVNELVSSRIINVQLGNEIIPFVMGEFRIAKQLYRSIDFGGVVEFYISPRWMARFDIGDTVIRYGELHAQGFTIRNSLLTRPPETRHNLQFSSGIGFRF